MWRTAPGPVTPQAMWPPDRRPSRRPFVGVALALAMVAVACEPNIYPDVPPQGQAADGGEQATPAPAVSSTGSTNTAATSRTGAGEPASPEGTTGQDEPTGQDGTTGKTGDTGPAGTPTVGLPGTSTSDTGATGGAPEGAPPTPGLPRATDSPGTPPGRQTPSSQDPGPNPPAGGGSPPAPGPTPPGPMPPGPTPPGPTPPQPTPPGPTLPAPVAADPTGEASATADVSGVGAWSNPATWGGRVPGAGATVAIPSGVKVRLDGDVRVGGITVDGELYFDPKSSSTIASSGNIVVNGLLHMKPETSAVDHVIEFTGVDERRFVGGGMKPVDSDVGLWVMGDGQLIVEGSPRRGWTTATGSVPKGATSVTVRDATGWRVGDRLSLTPTDRPGPDKIDDDDSDMRSGFHETTIAAISGNTVTFTSPTKEAHPKVDGKYGAELINLTRNVQIRGTASGKAHVFIHTQKYRHFIRWASFQNLGVADALGRYPLHIHHAGDSVNGSLIEGVVVEDGGHHSFVPHESHGLTMRDLVAYQSTGGDAYWWDLTDATNDLVWEHVIAAGVDSSGFYLGRGTNVTIRDAVAVGVENRFTVGGFEWENGSIGSWTAEDLVAHNNLSSGIRVWQNADIPQVIDGYIAYHNHRAAIDHGAYSNRYQYKNGHFFGNLGNAVILHATSDATQISFENLIIDGGGVTQGSPVLMAAANIPATTPTTFRNVEFKGTGSNPIFSFGTATKHQIRCVECRWPGGSTVAVFRAGGPEGNWLEVIDGDQATRYLPNGSTQRIAVPRPLPSGSGTGLRVEYFNEPNLTGLAYTTVLPGTTDPWELQTARPGYGAEPYHRLSVQDGYSARWTGELEIAVGEAGPYEFFSRFSAGIRVTIDGRTLIDDWDNTGLNGDYTDPYSAGYNKASFNLSPGRHDIEIELRDTTSGGGFWGSQFSLSWQYGGDLREVIPASRLYPSGPVPNNEPTAATPPR